MAIPAFGDISFKHFTLVIDGPPEIVRLAVYLHENLVQMPLPLGPGTHLVGPLSPDFRGEHRAEAVPPEAHRFVAQINPALMEQVLDVSKRERKPNVHHHRQADNFGRRFKVAKGVLHAPKISIYSLTPSFF